MTRLGLGVSLGAKGTKHRGRGGWKREGEPRLCVRLGSWPPFPRWPSAPDPGNSCPWRGWVRWVSKVGGACSKGHAIPRMTGLALLTQVDEPCSCPLVLLFQGPGHPWHLCSWHIQLLVLGLRTWHKYSLVISAQFPTEAHAPGSAMAVYKAVVANLAICTHMYVLKIEPASNQTNRWKAQLLKGGQELPALFFQLFSGSKVVSK